MSVSGISSNLFGFNTPSVQSKQQQIQQEFQQLGEDLQSGNLSAAQSDFTTLQQLVPQSSSTSSTSAATSSTANSNPLEQAFAQLGKDLQSGNLSAAQQDYANIEQDIQNQSSQVQSHGHHHHHRGGDDEQNTMSQLFEQLGQELESGNLSSAQQSYNTLAQDLQSFGVSSAQSGSQSASTSSGLSVNG
jgi:outer membrane protein assembly factor BamD (BamD/ComL family)